MLNKLLILDLIVENQGSSRIQDQPHMEPDSLEVFQVTGGFVLGMRVAEGGALPVVNSQFKLPVYHCYHGYNQGGLKCLSSYITIKYLTSYLSILGV